MNSKRYLWLIVFVLIIFNGGCQSKTEAASPLSAKLSELTGDVEARQTDNDTFLPASLETILETHGQVQTADDGRVRLDLSTGTIIRVGPSSIFTLIANDQVEGGLSTKIKMEAGKIFIILSGGSAEVETPSGVASVRGSYMKVEVDPVTHDIYVTCLEGSCSASNPAGTINFSGGESSVLYHQDPVTGNWTAPGTEPMTVEDFQEWLTENPEAKALFDQAMSTLTAIGPPTEPPAPTLEFTLTPAEAPSPTLETVVPPGPASSACFEILQPPSGSSFPKSAQVTFEWESQPGAQSYVMTFLDSSGGRAKIETTETSDTRYIEIFPNGGEYTWFVTAVGADGNEICSTTAFTFTKPQGDPTPKPTRIREPEPEPIDTSAPACKPADVCNPDKPACYDPTKCG